MKNVILPVIFLFLFITGCKPPVPKDLIQPEEMGKILYDIHLVDSYLNTIPNVDSSKIIAASYYKGIYKKFNVDSALYNRSMNFYADNPEIFSEIYKGLTSQLSKQKSDIVKADSLESVKLKKLAAVKAKKDSLKLLDSIKKFPASRRQILLKRADSIKKRDSLRNEFPSQIDPAQRRRFDKKTNSVKQLKVAFLEVRERKIKNHYVANLTGLKNYK
jgi:hypothetical protein